MEHIVSRGVEIEAGGAVLIPELPGPVRVWGQMGSGPGTNGRTQRGVDEELDLGGGRRISLASVSCAITCPFGGAQRRRSLRILIVPHVARRYN